jgi:hypothetical protein
MPHDTPLAVSSRPAWLPLVLLALALLTLGVHTQLPAQVLFARGDADADGSLDISDALLPDDTNGPNDVYAVPNPLLR